MIPPINPKIYIFGGVIVASFLVGHEWRDRAADAEISGIRQELAEESQKASERARKIEQLNAERAQLAAAAASLRNQEREVITETIYQEVVEYVPESIPADCPVGPDDGWLYRHDIAAAGSLPGATIAAAGPDARTEVITDFDALVAVTGNYGTCHEIRDQLVNLQEWVRSQF